ncbi:MAG: hypothetical protein KY434_03550 [Actinobacteria bacterium]|nr:hypothetical protein [Actinomycetota bacterium]
MATTTLDETPGLPGLYAKAALSAVADALPGPLGRGGGDRADLPDRTVRQDGARLDRDRLAAYQRVCGFRVSDDVPATYLHVRCFPLSVELMTASDFPIPLVGLVHVANTMTVHRRVGSGEALDLEVGVADLRPHRRGRVFDITAEVRPADQLEPSWTSRSTYLARGRGEGDDDAPRLEGVPGPAEGRTATAQWRVPADTGRRYARVSGDVNPIHLHPLAARLFGFRRAIAHGMWTAARALATLDGRLPQAWRYDVEFAKPLLLPATVELVTERAGDGWRLAVRSSSGPEHLRGLLAEGERGGR